MKKKILFFFFLLLSTSIFSQERSNLLDSLIFQAYKDSFPNINAHPEQYQLQMIYVQIDRDSTGFPHFTYHKTGVDREKFFYPASLIKLPTVLLSLEKLKDLEQFHIDKYSKLRIGTSYACQEPLTIDTTSIEGYPSIANFIRKILLVSDNKSYNRLYEFLGRDEINERLWKKGYDEVIIPSRFNRCTDEEDLYTNPFWFYDEGGSNTYFQPSKKSTQKFYNKNKNTVVGTAFYDEEQRKFIEAMDFNTKAILPIEDALQMMIDFVFPETVMDSTRIWDISVHDRYFLFQYMSMYPRQSSYKKYHKYEKYEDSYKKYFIVADTKDTIYDEDFKIFNVVGLSYGFTSEVAYVVNVRTGVEFFLAAALYTNEDNILNNNNYDYHKVAFPFYGKLGRIIYEMETAREKEYLPDFKEIKMATSIRQL